MPLAILTGRPIGVDSVDWPREKLAILYDNATSTAFGPVFNSPAEAEHFIAYLQARDLRATRLSSRALDRHHRTWQDTACRHCLCVLHPGHGHEERRTRSGKHILYCEPCERDADPWQPYWENRP